MVARTPRPSPCAPLDRTLSWAPTACRVLLSLVAVLVPRGERARWRDQWHADLAHRWSALQRTGCLNRRTEAALVSRALGAAAHAWWLRFNRGRVDMLQQDLRHAFRRLVQYPSLTAVATVTLGLGIGANAVIFSWVESLILNPLPNIRNQDRLVTMQATTPTRNNLSLSYPNFLDVRAQRPMGVRDVAVFASFPMSIRTADTAERVWGEVVSGNFFRTLDVQPALGRLLVDDDDRVPDGHPVAVLSHAAWQQRFGGTPDIVGRQVSLNGQPFTIVGVAEEGFRGAQAGLSFDVFVPTMMVGTVRPGDILHERGSGWLNTLVKLDAGTPLSQVQAGFAVVAARLAEAYPTVNEGRGLAVYTLSGSPQGVTSVLRPLFAVLTGVVAGLLVLVCANLAGLLLAGTGARRREVALRLAMGASRARVVRQLLVESAVLALAGGACGILLARWSGHLLRAFIPRLDVPVLVTSGLTPRVFLYGVGLSLATGVLFGVLPALQATRADVSATLKAGGDGRSSGVLWRRAWLRQGLVVVQVALALLMLVSASLFVRTLQNAWNADPGFAARRGFSVALDLLAAGYDEARGQVALQRIAQAVAALPGIEGASVARRLPLTVTDSSDMSVAVEGYTPAPKEEMPAFYNQVGPGYFATLQIPLVGGREFSAADAAGAPPVVIVNETMAKRYWSGRSALGGRVKIGGSWATVVGIAKEGKYGSLTETPRAYMYLPLLQVYRPTVRLIVRTAGDPQASIEAARRTIASVDPGLPLFDVATLDEHLAFAFFLFRMVATLLGVFGVAATALAVIGLYGVLAIGVAQRTREIGVRVSLGAERRDIVGLVARDGLRLVFAGIALGLAGSLGVTRLFENQLVGVSASDATSYASTVAILLATAVMACYLPARRASTLDPVRALRTE
ncbi:MAG: ABC transporter permease [Vicinamibacterales bacterium]